MPNNGFIELVYTNFVIDSDLRTSENCKADILNIWSGPVGPFEPTTALVPPRNHGDLLKVTALIDSESDVHRIIQVNTLYWRKSC